MKLLFLGDLLYDYDLIKNDITVISEYIKKNNLITVVNLEAPYKSDMPLQKWINLHQSKKVIEVLKLLNVKVVNLANNHIMDWSKEGLENLLLALKDNDITYIGAGMNLKDAKLVKILNINGKNIGFQGYGWEHEKCVPATSQGPGVAPLIEKKILQEVKVVKENLDLLIMNLHWGYEYELYPLPIHKRFAQNLVDSGVDLIIGHHAHVIQSYEIYNKKQIYYGLGNFYFGSRRDLFNNRENNIAKKYSRYGLGVIYDLNDLKTNHIYFKSENSKTEIIDDYSLENISEYNLQEYNKYYTQKKTSKSKPILYVSRFDTYINPLKLKAFLVKHSFKKKLYKSINESWLYKYLKNFSKE